MLISNNKIIPNLYPSIYLILIIIFYTHSQKSNRLYSHLFIGNDPILSIQYTNMIHKLTTSIL